MQKLEVFGAGRLKGKIAISGSKNASLPILAASLLSSKKVYLKNLPKVKDIETMINLLQSLGSKIKYNKKNLIINNLKQNKILLGEFYSKEWVMRNVLHFDDEDIKQMKDQIDDEMKSGEIGPDDDHINPAQGNDNE